MVGGDPFDAEKKGSNADHPFAGDINVLITANCRLLVRLHSDIPSWARRLIIVVFDGERPEVRIEGFAQKLIDEEGSGILNFALAGLLEYEADHQRCGDIILSKRQQARVDSLLNESDGMRQFISSEIVITDEDDLSGDEIITAYAGYAKAKGWRPLYGRLAQSQAQDLMMELHGITQSHDLKRAGKSAVRGYRGARLRGAQEEDPLP
jgi:phage/plasmid-associated DNA primase